MNMRTEGKLQLLEFEFDIGTYAVKLLSVNLLSQLIIHGYTVYVTEFAKRGLIHASDLVTL